MEFFTTVTGLAALAVLAVHQILKLNAIPVAFANKYPVPTNILLSIVASVIVVWQTAIDPDGFKEWLGLVTIIAVVAAIVYNQLIGKWAELRAMEGTGKKKDD